MYQYHFEKYLEVFDVRAHEAQGTIMLETIQAPTWMSGG